MLPFTADILFSSFEVYNRALWPVPLVALALGLAAVLMAFRPVGFSDRVIALLLVVAWLWVGVGYFVMHHAALDFAAPVYGVLFVVEGLLLGLAASRNRLTFRFRPDLAGWTGLALAIAGLIAWPLADWLTGHSWQSVRLVVLAPGPTTAFTLGMLLLTAGRTPVHLAVIPLLWTLVAGATAWVLAIPQDLALPLAGLGGFGLVLWKNRQR